MHVRNRVIARHKSAKRQWVGNSEDRGAPAYRTSAASENLTEPLRLSRLSAQIAWLMPRMRRARTRMM